MTETNTTMTAKTTTAIIMPTIVSIVSMIIMPPILLPETR